MSSVITSFDLCGPLPNRGTTVLEASAGTGKTHTIAALVTRYVAEGVSLREILAVTFTRIATGELRERIRARLVSAHGHLANLLDGEIPIPQDDQVALALAEGSTGEVLLRRERLAQAVASFDEATITTTHGFCQLMLQSMGVDGGAETGDRLIEDPSELIEQVVDDLYLRKALAFGQSHFSRSEGLEVARKALGNPDVALAPAGDDSTPGRLRRFADAVVEEFKLRLQRDGLLTYDDLLVRLRDALVDPQRGPAACKRLRERYGVVLIDEFQDTDPVQWHIVRSAFATDETVLLVIGDPKQSIFSFRGADVFAYLDASVTAGQRSTLLNNYRSDADLLAALDAVLSPLLLGHDEIAYHPVQATPARLRPGIEHAPSSAPLRFRVLKDDQDEVVLTGAKALLQKSSAVQWIARDLAADVVRLLSSPAELVEWGSGGAASDRRLVRASDIGVLVRTNDQAEIVHQALRGLGVPAVLASSRSIYGSQAASAWLALLEAVEQPWSRSRCVAVAFGPFVGMNADDVATATDRELDDLHLRLRRFGDVLRRNGVAALFRAALDEGAVPGRLLRYPDGERQMTDLTHVAELLGAQAMTARLGPSRLRAWLAGRMAESSSEISEELERRLDSDAEAVQVLTVHRAKGLEFPVVYLPYLFDPGGSSTSGPIVFHDPDAANQRTLDVGTSGGPKNNTPSYQAHLALSQAEERGEHLRHLYVAMTRAKHQLVVWWARCHESQHSPLGRLLFSRDPTGRVAAKGGSGVPYHAQVVSRLEALAEAAPGHIAIEVPPAVNTVPLAPGTTATPTLAAASLDRPVDEQWRRSSYSAITAAAHEEMIGSEPEERGTVDEPARPDPAETPPAEGVSRGAGDGEQLGVETPCRLGQMPSGADVGTALHGVLERIDFTSLNLEDEIAAALEVQMSRMGVDLGDAGLVVLGLVDALRTPLGPLTDDVALSDVGLTDRLSELSFEFPLLGGDTPKGSLTVGAIADLLKRHEQEGDPLAGYGDHLADPVLARTLRGYLSGSIDLVFRRQSADDARFFVVDYKSNRLAPSSTVLTAGHYVPAALAREMQRAHYPLQALLYLVALHRYLRWRLAGYDPERHLGGVLYLFLRGMLGTNGPTVDGQSCGVFAWRPSSELILELSDLLDVGAGETRRAS